MSHRSVLPQQVKPFVDEAPTVTAEGVENIFFTFLLRQEEQNISTLSWIERKKTSVTFPHSWHLYS
jgi:hypothetical protein